MMRWRSVPKSRRLARRQAENALRQGGCARDSAVHAMSWKRRFQGGLLGFIGFLLSPLSWWNDLVINVPLAIGFAWLVSLLHRPAFGPAVVVGYWLTNVIGLILMHKGAQRAFGKG